MKLAIRIQEKKIRTGEEFQAFRCPTCNKKFWKIAALNGICTCPGCKEKLEF